MATHDYVIANGTGAAVRSDLNNVLQAIATNNSNATDPSSTFAYQWYADTGDGKLYVRNAANNAWILVGTLASANLGLVDAAAPTLTGDVTCSSTGFLKIPAGTTAQQPTGGALAVGQFRWNTTLGKAEIYDGSSFTEVGGGGGAVGGGDDKMFLNYGQTVTEDYAIPANTNSLTAGPVSIANNKSVTIPSTSNWTIV